MKIFLPLALLVLKLLPAAQAQEATTDYTVFYNFTFVTDTIENHFSSPEEFMLFRVGNESRFTSSARYYNDSTSMVFSQKHPEPNMNKKKEVQQYIALVQSRTDRKQVRSRYQIIKNFETNSFKSILPFVNYPIQYLEEPMQYDWEITGQTDTILGLACTQASTNYGGRLYFAWFAPEVPINDGPYVFHGLPGLIVKVTDEEGWYEFIATKIMTKKTNRYISPYWLNEHNIVRKLTAKDLWIK